MRLIRFLKPCFSTVLIGIISLAMQNVIALVICIASDFFSDGVMAEKHCSQIHFKG